MQKSIMTKDLALLSSMQFFERIVFYGTLTLLLFTLTKHYHFSMRYSYEFWGLFLGLAYLLPFWGGLLADKYWGFVNTTICGGYCMAVGCSLLAISKTIHQFYWGITVQLIGFGLFKSNIGSLVGMLYTSKSSIKDQAFTLFFMAMAAGAISGPIIFGLCVRYIGLYMGFTISAVGIFVVSLFFSIYRKKVKFETMPERPKAANSAIFFIVIVATILIFGVHYLLIRAAMGNRLIGFLSVVFFIIFALRAALVTRAEQKRVIALVILIATTIVWYSASLQVDGSLLLLIKQHVNHVIFGWSIPVTFFSSLEGIFAILLSPFIIFLWVKLQQKNKDWLVCTKVALGMLFAAVCFTLFGLAALMAHTNIVPVLFITVGAAFLGLSDVFDIPIVMSAVSTYSPPSILGTMMGIVMMRNAFAGYIASQVGSLTVSSQNHTGIYNYAKVFILVAIICIIIAFLLIFIRNKLRNLLGEAGKC